MRFKFKSDVRWFGLFHVGVEDIQIEINHADPSIYNSKLKAYFRSFFRPFITVEWKMVVENPNRQLANEPQY